MKKYTNLLMLGGTSKNSGKTTAICHIIEHCHDVKIIAVKAILYDNADAFAHHYPEHRDEDFFFIQEIGPHDKDSGRYLQSGASESWFMASHTSGNEKLVMKMNTLCETGKPVILESNTLRRYINPALYIVLVNRDKEIKRSALENIHMADVKLDAGNLNRLEQIFFEKGSWKTKCAND